MRLWCKMRPQPRRRRFSRHITLLSAAAGGLARRAEGGRIRSSAGQEATHPSYPSKITSVSISGKKLFIFGEDFVPGAVILLNGEEQQTRNDDQNPGPNLRPNEYQCLKGNDPVPVPDKG
jgi:hypothetical protein